MIIQQTHFGTDLELRCGHVDGAHTSADHLHQYFEFELILDGEIEITVDGKKYIAQQGDIAIITPFKTHSFYTEKYVKMLICTFPNSFLTDFLSYRDLCKNREPYVFHASEPLWSFLMNGGFYENAHTKSTFDYVSDFGLIHRLRSTFYLIISEYFEKSSEVEKSGINNTLSKILIYISENFNKDISLQSVGVALGYSPKYVSDCMKAVPNLGFRSFINSLRVEYAKNLLANSNKNNIEIAYACGFVSQTSFHRVFREFVKTTPHKYRAQVAGSGAFLG